MATKQNWLWGCGIGCGVLLLAAIAVPAGCALLIRGTMEDFDHAVESREVLDERFGAADTFVPWPEGAIPAERMERFLQVRETTQPARQSLSRRFEVLFSAAGEAQGIEDKGFFEKLRFGLGMARTGVGMAPDLGAFFDDRNRALLDVEMGLGEYAYLYTLSYYGLLEHSPGDDPADLLKEVEGVDNSPVDVDTGMDTSTRRVRRELRGMLERQLAALPPDADPQWRSALSAEIAALNADRERFPWQAGLPEPLRASLAPWADRLEATYDPVTNSFELTRNRKRGAFTYTTD